MLFGHRTTHGAPFLNINLGADRRAGHVARHRRPHYNYVVVRQDVTVPSYNIINNIGVNSGLATVQLVACTPPHSVKFRRVTTARLVSVT